MFARVFACAVIGLDGAIVEVEVDTGSDMGMPGASVQEGYEHGVSAIKNAGLHYPRKWITVNLAPASVRKEDPEYGLPIFLGILIAGDVLDGDSLKDSVVLGEVSLDGSVRHVSGVLPMITVARREGYRRVIVPSVDAPEAALLPELEVIPVNNLKELFLHLKGIQPIKPFPLIKTEDLQVQIQTDFREIKRQEHAKRARTIADQAVAGNIFPVHLAEAIQYRPRLDFL